MVSRSSEPKFSRTAILSTSQSMESIMHRAVLALTLIAAFSVPAFAESEKAERDHAQPAPTQEGTVKKAPAQVNDPDWSPCDYNSESDPNGCE